jgi:hypothetical protein
MSFSHSIIENHRTDRVTRNSQLSRKALVGFRGVGLGHAKGRNERAEEGFAATACVVHELKAAEVKRQLVMRDAPVRAPPGAQQRPETLQALLGFRGVERQGSG